MCGGCSGANAANEKVHKLCENVSAQRFSLTLFSSHIQINSPMFRFVVLIFFVWRSGKGRRREKSGEELRGFHSEDLHVAGCMWYELLY